MNLSVQKLHFFVCQIILSSLYLVSNANVIKVDKSRVFLLVLDGVVHDFDKLHPNMTNLHHIAANGVRAERMIPAFPSDTWPTMTTLNTGLYTESHGILRNVMCDDATNVTFDPSAENFTEIYGHFYSQEPLWLTNQKQGGNSSVYRWPGHLAFPEKPKYHESSNHINAHNLSLVIEAIEETFEHLKTDSSLNFMVVYADYPDPVGHAYGVHSDEYRDAISKIDRDVIGNIKKRMEDYPDINFVIVADHGMADLTDNKTSVLVMDTILQKNAYIIKGAQQIKPTVNFTVDDLWANLTKLNDSGVAQIFRKDDPRYDFPYDLHYRADPRIPPILVLTKPNWKIIKNNKTNVTIGNHGYDIKYKEMSTIFFAQGPAFKKNITLPPFESVNVVPLLAHLLGIQARPNNGTLSVFKDALVNDVHEDNTINKTTSTTEETTSLQITTDTNPAPITTAATTQETTSQQEIYTTGQMSTTTATTTTTQTSQQQVETTRNPNSLDGLTEYDRFIYY